MTAYERVQLMQDPQAYALFVAEQDAKFVSRMQKIHTETFACETWETWTVRQMCQFSDGRRMADCVYEGCRQHNVALLQD